MRENRKHITRLSSDEARELRDDTADARFDAMTDDDIARAVADDPDAVPLDIDWTKASLVIPPGKEVVTLRLDRDLLEWFRIQGKGYQTRINQVLRVFYESRRSLVEEIKERRAMGAQSASSEDPIAELSRLVDDFWPEPANEQGQVQKQDEAPAPHERLRAHRKTTAKAAAYNAALNEKGLAFQKAAERHAAKKVATKKKTRAQAVRPTAAKKTRITHP
jgi:uncharacterized protein (DUF4415 family)